jgi:hypothetical protein
MYPKGLHARALLIQAIKTSDRHKGLCTHNGPPLCYSFKATHPPSFEQTGGTSKPKTDWFKEVKMQACYVIVSLLYSCTSNFHITSLDVEPRTWQLLGPCRPSLLGPLSLPLRLTAFHPGITVCPSWKQLDACSSSASRASKGPEKPYACGSCAILCLRNPA